MQIPRFWGAALCSLVSLTACGIRPAVSDPIPAPPVAPIRTVTDTYFGHRVDDPYRWMENLNDPEVKTWMRGQNDYARSVLAQIPERAALLTRIRALDDTVTRVSSLQFGGRRIFFLKRRPQDNTHKLYVRNGLHGKDRLLFDPDTVARRGSHDSIDFFAPSHTGRYVAYGVSPGGSENSVLSVMDVDTGRTFPEKITRTELADPRWSLDDRSFFYNRLQPLTAASLETAKYQKSRVYRHVLGTNPERDTPVFGYGLTPKVTLKVDDAPALVAIAGSPFVYALVFRGVQNEIAIYAAPTNTVRDARTPWHLIVDFSDDVTQMDAHGDTVYLLTHKNTPHFKVIATSATHPDLAHAHTIIPSSATVVQSVGVAADALYVRDQRGGFSHIRRVAFDGHRTQTLALPFSGAADTLTTDPTHAGVLMELESWTKPSACLNYDPQTGTVTDTKLIPQPLIDYSGIESREVLAKSADGTLVPLSIILKKGTVLDGSHPTLLDGYGSYALNIDPGFSPTLLAWLERGGIYAAAHVRGGGELGEEWYRGGLKLTKQNTISDFIACAEYLIAEKYTSPSHLAGEGTSAGGITIGGAITQRPDLFAAALDRVGATNTLRDELTPNGPSNIPEFGTTTTRDGFQGLFTMDAYTHVVNGAHYPAVMVETGINDPRVAPWEPAKMAARLEAASTSGKPILLRVDYDAGHGIGSTKLQRDQLIADEDAFLFWQLGGKD